MIIGPAGGHADYGGNDAWEYDYENRPADFLKHNEPDFTAIYSGPYTPEEKYALLAPYVDNVNYPGAVMSGGQPLRPISRHTYASAVWMSWENRMTLGGGSTYSGMTPVNYWGNVWPNSPQDFWWYDPVGKVFEYKNSELLDPAYRVVPRFAAHEGRQRLYGVVTNVSNRAAIREYNSATDTWTEHAEVGPVTGLAGVKLVVDELRDRIIVLQRVGTNAVTVAMYDLATRVWSDFPTTGPAPTTLDAEAWAIHATHLDEVWMLRSTALGMSKLDLQTGEWTTEAISGPDFLQCSGNWFYDRRRRVAMFTYQKLGAGIRVWTYKR
jgi:hypothetical protein